MIGDSLKHFGVLGMHWGVRRDKKSRGSGLKRSQDSATAHRLKKKKLSEMSNDELRKLNTRLQLERQYKDLSKGNVSAGRKIVGNIFSNVGKNLVTQYITKAATSGAERLFNYALERDK